MPRFNIYIRNEDLEAWNKIENKPDWLHSALNGLDKHLADIAEAQLNHFAKKNDLPPINRTNGVCKIHDTQLDNRGRCLQKGCRFG